MYAGTYTRKYFQIEIPTSYKKKRKRTVNKLKTRKESLPFVMSLNRGGYRSVLKLGFGPLCDILSIIDKTGKHKCIKGNVRLIINK